MLLGDGLSANSQQRLSQEKLALVCFCDRQTDGHPDRSNTSACIACFATSLVKHSESANLRQTAILNFVDIKPQPSYCKRKTFSTAVMTLNFELDLSKVYNMSQMLNFCAKFNEYSVSAFRKITSADM